MVRPLTDNEIQMIRAMLSVMESEDAPEEWPRKSKALHPHEMVSESCSNFAVGDNTLAGVIAALKPISAAFGFDTVLDYVNLHAPADLRDGLNALEFKKFFHALVYYADGYADETERDAPLTTAELCRSLGYALGALLKSDIASRIQLDDGHATVAQIIREWQGDCYRWAQFLGCNRAPRFSKPNDIEYHGGGYHGGGA